MVCFWDLSYKIRKKERCNIRCIYALYVTLDKLGLNMGHSLSRDRMMTKIWRKKGVTLNKLGLNVKNRMQGISKNVNRFPTYCHL